MNDNKRDNSNIETLGVTYLGNCIANSKYLHPVFQKDDKIPLFDGKIIIYKNTPFSINNYIGDLPVQIKTTTKFLNNKKSIYKSIKRKYLENYFNARGVIYFYISFNNNQYYIYYSFLSQLKIQKYLKENKNNISVELSEFPKDNMTLFTNLIIEFYKETKCTASEFPFSLGDLQKLKNAGFDQLSINISTIGYKNPLDRLYDHPVYIHAKNTTIGIEITIDEKYFKFGRQENNPIKVNNKIYYNHIDIINDKDKMVYHFGKNI